MVLISLETLLHLELRVSQADNLHYFQKSLQLNLALLKDVCPPNSQENPILNEDLPKRENNKNNLWKGFYILLAFIITTETFVEIINLLKE